MTKENEIKQLFNTFKNSEILNNNKDRIIAIIRFGSHLYGTNTDQSDLDYKVVYIPRLEDYILNKVKKSSYNLTTGKDTSRNNQKDMDIELIPINSFFKFCKEAQTLSLDMLFANAENILYKTKSWDKIISYRDSLLIHKDASRFIGYCINQAAKYGIKGSKLKALEIFKDLIQNLDPNTKLETEPNIIKTIEDTPNIDIEYSTIDNVQKPFFIVWNNRRFQTNVKIKHILPAVDKLYGYYGQRAILAKENQGIDYKAISHALRVCYQVIELFETGHIKMPLEKADYLRDVKLGKYNYTDLEEIIPELIKRIRWLEVYTDKVNAKFNKEKANDLLLSLIKESIHENK